MNAIGHLKELPDERQIYIDPIGLKGIDLFSSSFARDRVDCETKRTVERDPQRSHYRLFPFRRQEIRPRRSAVAARTHPHRWTTVSFIMDFYHSIKKNKFLRMPKGPLLQYRVIVFDMWRIRYNYLWERKLHLCVCCFINWLIKSIFSSGVMYRYQCNQCDQRFTCSTNLKVEF